MSLKTYLNILKGGIFLSFLSIFFVFDHLLFPYITSKQIPFNILIEIMTVFWLGLIVKYPSYRPQKSWITFGLVGFMAVLILTSITGVDFNMSFWGNIERMLGVFHLLHFLVFYLIIITVMRSWEDWRNLLMVSVIAATLQTLFVIFKVNFGTLGNTSYISGQMIFNIFFALILFFRQKNIAWRSFYVVAILLMLQATKIASTRGAFIGLGLSIITMFFMLAMFNNNKKIKYGSLGVVAAFVIFIALIFANAESAWVKNNGLFNRITQINFQTGTFQTRLVSWRSAVKDFPNHPFLGTGYGNYAITFDKHFDPIFYNFTASETYFDHAHNNILDLLSTTGAIGLTVYLLIFVATLYYLISGFRAERIKLSEFIILIGLIVAYFVQNIVLFDSFITYLSLMVMLGFVYWLSIDESYFTEASAKAKQIFKGNDNRESYALIIGGLIMLAVMYQYNVKPLKMLSGTIDGQIVAAQGSSIIEIIKTYKQALSYDTVLDRDSRKSLVQLAMQRSELFSDLNKESANQAFDYIIEQAEKNVAHNSKDSFNQMMLAQLYNLAASHNTADKEKFIYYSSRAEDAINKTIEATPRRIPVYFIKAQIYLMRGDKAKAAEIVKTASELNPKYPDSYCQLSRIYFYDDKEALGNEAMDKCIELGGAGQLGSIEQLKEVLNRYLRNKDLNKALMILQQITRAEPNVGKNWASLAEVYRQMGDNAEAIKAAEQAIQVDPSLRAGGEEFIRSLK